MEDPRKHDKKNSNKTMPVAINIGAGAGAGSFGIGGLVLFGGALVTATLVSALAIKTRRQRRSSSDTIKKSRSPSPEPQTVDAPNELELMMKINKDRESSKDFAIESSPLDLQNPSDGVSSMKEMQTKPIQNSIPDEKQNFEMDNDEKVDSGDGNEDVIFSVVGDDQESTSIYVDSVYEREEFDNGYEKIPVECEEQVVVAARTEGGSQSIEEESRSEISVNGALKDAGGEEQKYSKLVDDEQTDSSTDKPLVTNEALTSIEEDEAIEGVGEEDQATVEEEESIQYEKARDVTVEAAAVKVSLGDDVADVVEEIPIGHVGEDQETVFMNEEEAVQEEAMEAASVYQIEVEDNPQVQFLEEREKNGHDEMILENFEELINETGSADQTVGEQVTGEVIDAACVRQIEVEGNPRVQVLGEERETDGHDEIILESCERDSSNGTDSADQIVREENQQMQCNGEQVMGEEKAIEAACVEDVLEMAHNEVVLEDVQEMEVSEVHEAFSSGEHSSSAVAYIMNLNDSLRVAVDDQTAVIDNPPRPSTNKEEKAEQTAEKVEVQEITEDEFVNKEEKGKEDEIPHVQLIEEAKDDDQTAVREDNPPWQLMNKEKGQETAAKVQVKMITEDELVNKEEKGMEDEVPHVELIKEAKYDDQTEDNLKEETAEEVRVEMITEDELVKKEDESKEDEIPHVQSIEEDEEAKDDEEDATMETEEGSHGTGDSSNGVAIRPDESMQEEQTPETKISSQKIEEVMEEDWAIEGKEQNDSDHNKIMNKEKGGESGERFVMELAKERKQAPANEPWKLKLRTWSVLVSIWCLCHWYSELPFPELSLVGSLLFILVLLGSRNLRVEMS